MAVSIPHKQTRFHSENIIKGFAEIIARNINGVTYWELPGGVQTRSREHAQKVARKMDSMIRVNKERMNRSLLWS